MMENILEYKGYHTRIEFNSESLTLRGKIEGINDYVDFECDDIKNIEAEFHEAVDDYLAFCEEVGKTPEKEYKGSFNVRISPDLHKKLALRAYKDECSLNSLVEKAVAVFLENDKAHISITSDTQDIVGKIPMPSQDYKNETTVKNNIIQFGRIKQTPEGEAEVL